MEKYTLSQKYLDTAETYDFRYFLINSPHPGPGDTK